MFLQASTHIRDQLPLCPGLVTPFMKPSLKCYLHLHPNSLSLIFETRIKDHIVLLLGSVGLSAALAKNNKSGTQPGNASLKCE